MPTRTYTGVDLINYLLTDNSSHGSDTGSSSVVVTPISQGIVTGVGAADDSQAGVGSLNAFANVQYTITGDFDFDAFPAIPNNAMISSIRVKVANNGSGNSSGTASVGLLDAITSAGNAVELPIGNSLPTLLFSVFDLDGPAASVNASCSGSVTFSVEEELIVGPPIDKATLVANFSNISISITGGATIGNNGAMTGSGSVSSVGDMNNFQVIITYTSGPEIILTPPSGNVEPGQSVVATGDGVSILQYAALHGGNRVIPIVPKVIGPDEVILEIPGPADAPCADCFNNCPECDTCFTACENDLTSDACQECLSTCLDCLIDCLEDLEAAEACIGTTGELPTSTVIILIAADPGTQFAGSVPLGTFTILVADATGMYRLVPGKINDTLYSSARDGTTYDVKIPDPFGKTGFFRS